MHEPNTQSCREYNALSRRKFMIGAMGAGLATALPAWLPQVAYAQDGPSRDVLVSIYLRGGADGLSLCPPYGEDAYYTLRPTLAIPRPDSGDPNRAVDLNGFFGLNKALAPLKAAYDAKHLLVVHATGSVDPTRSHFDAQHYMEMGKPSDPRLQTGWLGRHLASMTPRYSDAPLRAIGFSYGLPETLYGAPQTLPIPYPEYFGLAGDWDSLLRRWDWLQNVYGRISGPLQIAAQNTQNTIELLDQIEFDAYKPGGGAVYPDSSQNPIADFTHALQSSAALIKADVGVEAVHIDVGGWDTHTWQGPKDGYLANLLTYFASSLAAFHTDIFSSAFTNVTVVIMSEFGRNVAENASQGTDHGHGNVMFVFGKNIKGGQVLAKWPGLSAEQQYEGQDLQVTIDHRDILAEIVKKRLKNSKLSTVFPDYKPVFQGIAT